MKIPPISPRATILALLLVVLALVFPTNKNTIPRHRSPCTVHRFPLAKSVSCPAW